ncbi:DNA-binding response regulator [Clostridia bacterium]|nr:DNA-binding response regulator [Clostridia bacterium]
MFSILVVEDDSSARRFMEIVLRDAGYHPYCAADAQAALDIMERQHIDLMITDIMMPGVDGYQLTQSIRDSGSMLPILMVTAKEAQKDMKRGFLVGSDDYMIKPIDEEEMLLRVKALLRRAQIVSERRITVSDVTLSYDLLTVSKGGTHITLPQKEFYLLYKLLSFPNVIFTRIQLMDEIWGMDSDSDVRTVNVHINRLRERFDGWPEFEIVTVRGLGYKAVRNEQIS